MAVRARASVASQLVEIAVVESRPTPRDGVAWVAVAIEPRGAVPLRDDTAPAWPGKNGRQYIDD